VIKKSSKTFKSQKPQQNVLPSVGEPITYFKPVHDFPGLECFEFSSVISHGWFGNRNGILSVKFPMLIIPKCSLLEQVEKQHNGFTWKTAVIKEVVVTNISTTWGKQTGVCSWADTLCRRLRWLYAEQMSLPDDLNWHKTRLHIRFQPHAINTSTIGTNYAAKSFWLFGKNTLTAKRLSIIAVLWGSQVSAVDWLIDELRFFLHPTRHKQGNFWDFLSSQSLGIVLKKLILRQWKQTMQKQNSPGKNRKHIQNAKPQKLTKTKSKPTVSFKNWLYACWMMIRIVGGWVFLLVLAHPGSPGQGRKSVVVVCVCVVRKCCCYQCFDTVGWAAWGASSL